MIKNLTYQNQILKPLDPNLKVLIPKHLNLFIKALDPNL